MKECKEALDKHSTHVEDYRSGKKPVTYSELMTIANGLKKPLARCLVYLETEAMFEKALSKPCEEPVTSVFHAAAHLFGLSSILAKDDPMWWIEDAFVGKYKTLGEWVEETWADAAVPSSIRKYIDWEAFGEDLAGRDGVLTVQGEDVIYVFSDYERD